MKIRLDYDRDGLMIDVPDENLSGILEQENRANVEEPQALIREAMANPIDAPRLEEMARGRADACVVIPDVTRPLPLRELLPPVLAAIERGGIAHERITILIATGLHRPNEGSELEEMVGADIVRKHPIVNHHARRMEEHVHLGQTTTGVPMHVDRRLCQAALKVTLGLVEPHFMAGFSGGRKMICPGICAEPTIRAFHRPDLIEHPNSVNLRLDGNPIHRTSTEIARRAGIDFSVNVILSSRRRIVAVAAGELESAFEEAARLAHAEVAIPIKHPADIVITTGGGYPLDRTWYQSIKGLAAALPGVKRGGTIIQATGLGEGVGTEEFRRLIRETPTLSDFMRQIREPGFYRDEQWQLEWFGLVAARVAPSGIMLYSTGIPRDVQRTLFVEPFESIETGLRRALERHGRQARVLVMPHGPYLLPVPG